MVLITEEEVAWFDILVQNSELMTVSQGCSTLKSYTTELVYIAFQIELGHRATLQVLHQLVVTVLTIHIGLTKVVHLYYHLKVEVQNRLQYLTVHIEIGIVHFQYIFLVVFLNQENLGLTCILAQY